MLRHRRETTHAGERENHGAVNITAIRGACSNNERVKRARDNRPLAFHLLLSASHCATSPHVAKPVARLPRCLENVPFFLGFQDGPRFRKPPPLIR